MVTVRDAFGNPVSGATVGLSASGTGNALTQPVGPTDASGVAGGVFVADRAGHSVWRLGPGAGEQRRVAGTGSIAKHSIEHSGDATDTPLRSPWGLLRTDDGLLVSMAGSHQLFSLDLGDDRRFSHGSGSLVLVAGTGAEELRDAVLLRLDRRRHERDGVREELRRDEPDEGRAAVEERLRIPCSQLENRPGV